MQIKKAILEASENVVLMNHLDFYQGGKVELCVCIQPKFVLPINIIVSRSIDSAEEKNLITLEES